MYGKGAARILQKVDSFGHWDPSRTAEYLKFRTNETDDFSGADISTGLVYVIPYDDDCSNVSELFALPVRFGLVIAV